MISQANRRPGHASCLSTIRSKPFAPVFTFQKTGFARQGVCQGSALPRLKGPAVVPKGQSRITLYHFRRRQTSIVLNCNNRIGPNPYAGRHLPISVTAAFAAPYKEME
jgi:hypothetical protein